MYVQYRSKVTLLSLTFYQACSIWADQATLVTYVNLAHSLLYVWRVQLSSTEHRIGWIYKSYQTLLDLLHCYTFNRQQVRMTLSLSSCMYVRMCILIYRLIWRFSIMYSFKLGCRHFSSCCLSIRIMKKKSVDLKNCAASKVIVNTHTVSCTELTSLATGLQVPQNTHTYLLNIILTCWMFWMPSLHVHPLYHDLSVC